MSYSIIFETKICKLDNGDYIHFSRQGCNNDNAGRDRYDFTGKYYTAEEWEKEIQHWENIERNGEFDLKIGSRYVEYADYGKHLRTMTKRAKSIEEYIEQNHLRGQVYDGITYYPELGEPVDYPADSKKIDDIVYGIWYGRIKGTYRNRRHIVDTEEEIIDSIKKGEHANFYFAKTKKKTI